MRKILILVLAILLFPLPVYAVEMVRQKNQATYIMFPIVDADGDAVSAAAGLDSEIDTWSDGTAPNGFVDCTNEATEVGTNGVYYLSLTAAEMNVDYIYIQVKTTTTGAKTQHILIRTLVGDPLNLATTDDGSAINVTSGAVDTVASVSNDVGISQAGADKVWSTTTRALTDKTGFRLSALGVDDIWDELTSGHTTAGSYGKLLTDNIDATISSRSSHAAADVWSVGTRTITGGTIDINNDKSGYSLTQGFPTNFSSLAITVGGAVTVGTNNDKTGYTVSTVQDKTGYSLTQAFPSNFSSLAITAGGAVTAGTVNDKAGYSLSASGIDSIWDELTTGHTTTGSYGKLLTDNIDAAISSRSTYSGGAVASVTGNVGGTVNGLTATAKTDVENAVWEAAASSHNNAGTMGNKLNSAGDPWNTALPGSYGAGTAGYILGTNLNATVGSRSTLTAANVWDTDLSGYSTANLAGTLLKGAGSAGDPWSTTIPGAYGAGTAGYIVGNNLNATVASRSSHSASDVWAVGTRTVTGGTVSNVTNGVTVLTNNDKTGYSLTQAFPTNFSALSIDVSGRMDLGKWVGNAPNALISGRVDSNAQVVGDKSGYSLIQSFPSNFSSLAITAGGAVTVGTNNDKTGYALTSTQEDAIVDKVWDELRSAHVTSGSFGQGVASIQGNVTGSVNSVTSGVTVSTNNDKSGYRLSASGVDDIWDEPQSGHTGAGTFGKYLDVQLSSITAPSAATIASAVWEETSNHVTDGTMGKKLNDAALAGDPWAAAGICDGLTAGQCLSGIKDATDGDKEGSDYTGIEKAIRAQR